MQSCTASEIENVRRPRFNVALAGNAAAFQQHSDRIKSNHSNYSTVVALGNGNGIV